jgi:hypothetical protein
MLVSCWLAAMHDGVSIQLAALHGGVSIQLLLSVVSGGVRSQLDVLHG